MDDLVASGVKMLVVACNSASAASLATPASATTSRWWRSCCPPSAAATAATRNGHVGVIGTSATITSGAYEDAFAAAPQSITSAACPSFVDFVERGVTSGRQLLGPGPVLPRPADRRRRRHRRPRLHYPMLTGVISLVMGDDVALVSSRPRTAKDVYRVLTRADLPRRGRTAARAPLPGHRRPGALRPAGTTLPRSRGRSGAARRIGGGPVKLTVIGCAGSAPGPKSPASCYLVEHDGFRLLLDLGNGAFGPLQGLLDPATIDAVFLSHLHADHCLDVAPFVVAPLLRSVDVRPGAALRAGRSRAAAGAGLRHGRRRHHRRLRLRAGRPGSFALGPFEVTLARTAHPVECYAIRLSVDGRSLVYTGDTGPSDAPWWSSPAAPTSCSPRRPTRPVSSSRPSCT